MNAPAHPAAPHAFSTRDLVAACAVVLSWGLVFISMKMGLRHLTPLQLGAARFLISAFPLMLLLRPPPIGARWIVAHGLLQGAGQFGLLFLALKIGMTAALAPVLMQMQIFVTALLGVVMLGERISQPLKVGLVLAGAGLACFAFNALSGGSGGGSSAVTVAGLLLTLAAASMWAASNILIRKLHGRGVKYDFLALMVWSGLVSGLTFAALSLAIDPPEVRWAWLDAPWPTWAWIVYMSWGANVLGYGLWTWLMGRHPASKVAPFSLGVPVIGLFAGILILGEVVTPWQWAGAVLVLLALVSVVAGGLVRAPRR